MYVSWQHYIIYMGATNPSSNGSGDVAELAHLQLLSSIVPRFIMYHLDHLFVIIHVMPTGLYIDVCILCMYIYMHICYM